MVEFQGAIPINLKGNMWESEDLIENKTDWKMPPKEGDGAWHIKMEMIDPDGEKFNRIFQSLPTTRKLSEKKSQAISSTWNIFMIPMSVTPIFGKHLEEKHVTWARFGKKLDKDTTLGLSVHEDGIGVCCDAIKSEGRRCHYDLRRHHDKLLKNPLEDSAGRRHQETLTTLSNPIFYIYKPYFSYHVWKKVEESRDNFVAAILADFQGFLTI
ncbi:hypothetical protein Tco_0141063 [Tanacetum coccineum]